MIKTDRKLQKCLCLIKMYVNLQAYYLEVKTMKNLLMILFVFAGTAFLNAQPGGSPLGGRKPTPIDGGLSTLLAAGAAYGFKKIRDHRKKSVDENA